MKITRTSGSIDPEVDSFVRGIYATARTLLERDGSLRAMLFIETPRGHVAVDVAQGMSPGAKDQLAAFMRRAVRQLQATSMLFLSEIWYRTEKPPANEEDAKRLEETMNRGVSQMPDRKEALMLNLMCSNDPGSFSALVDIERDEEGKPSLPEAMPPLQYASQWQGRFGNPWYP